MPLVGNAPQKDVTYRIIGAAMEIHNKLGPAHTEEIYQKALELKLPEAGLSLEPQRPVEVFLDETECPIRYPLGIGSPLPLRAVAKLPRHGQGQEQGACPIRYPLGIYRLA